MSKTPSFQDLTEEDREPIADRLSELVVQLKGLGPAATVAGVSTRQLRKYLKGEVAPPLVVAWKLVTATGRSLDWLVTGADSSGTGRDTQRDSLSPPKANQVVRWVNEVAAALDETNSTFDIQLGQEELQGLAGDIVDSAAQLGPLHKGLVDLVRAANRAGIQAAQARRRRRQSE